MKSQPKSDGADLVVELIRQARAGDADALGRLMGACRQYLLLIANEELPRELTAKIAPSDLVQQTFIEACKGFHRFHGHSKAEVLAWLRTILRANAADAVRFWKKTAKRTINREVEFSSRFSRRASIISNHVSPGSEIQAQEEERLLLEAIASLPDDYRTVIELHHRDGLSFPAIATRMDRSAEAVQKLWTRAVRRMQQQMGDG